ncbi:MAG TPA: DNA/RNA non-specific endonuclease, partial [Acidimicrobiales bacterium]|nr:DNA/RNA non-specific endonuclease [Acidimicrobiales bacterium]
RPPNLGAIDFSQLGSLMNRNAVVGENCELCRLAEAARAFPSQRGINWDALQPNLLIPWAMGPLGNRIHKVQPGVYGDSRCRGACGPNCWACAGPMDLFRCGEDEDGDTRWWKYPNVQVCGTAQGCKDHDACYDYFLGVRGESASTPFGLGHRVCDLEAVCRHGSRASLGWAVGAGPQAGTALRFSDHPVVCGPCAAGEVGVQRQADPQDGCGSQSIVPSAVPTMVPPRRPGRRPRQDPGACPPTGVDEDPRYGQLRRVVHHGRDYGVQGAGWGQGALSPELLVRSPGTSAAGTIRPPGYVSGSSRQHARGHLVANTLGGSGRTMQNLVTLFQDRNRSDMYEGFERPVREKVASCEVVDYEVTPRYDDTGPLPVRRVHIDARSRTSSWRLIGDVDNT